MKQFLAHVRTRSGKEIVVPITNADDLNTDTMSCADVSVQLGSMINASEISFGIGDYIFFIEAVEAIKITEQQPGDAQ